MVILGIDLTGRDAVFISNSYRYHSGLCTLHLYRNPPDRLPNTEKLKEMIDQLQQAYEGGATGDRVQIAARIQARKHLTDTFKKILSFLQSVSAEEDIPALIQAGFEVRRGLIRKKVPIPAT